MADWVSPRLNIRFSLSKTGLEIYSPDGTQFLTYTEIAQRFEQERQRAEQVEQGIRDAISQLLELGLGVEQVAEALGGH